MPLIIALCLAVLSLGLARSSRAETWDGDLTWASSGSNGVKVESMTCITSPVVSGQYVAWAVKVEGTVRSRPARLDVVAKGPASEILRELEASLLAECGDRADEVRSFFE